MAVQLIHITPRDRDDYFIVSVPRRPELTRYPLSLDEALGYRRELARRGVR